MSADVFMTTAQAVQRVEEEKVFGRPYNGRYHLPLLPDEKGSKACPTWVPRGVRRMTNLAGVLVDTRALSVWEQAMALAGLAMRPELYEELCLLVHRALLDGTDFTRLRDFPHVREALAGQPFKDSDCIAKQAKHAAGSNVGTQRGTNRHDAWEVRGTSGHLIGTPQIQEQMVDTERLLAEAGLERIPGLQERVVRNVQLGAAGKFDDILREQRTGRLLMADLKTKPTPVFSWLEWDIQLAGYARAEWMLEGDRYVPGPAGYVDQDEGVILHVPSDGGPARLERADLQEGWRNALLAVQVYEARERARSAERHARAVWG